MQLDRQQEGFKQPVTSLWHFSLVFLGGGIGALCRHLVGLLAVRHFGLAFPWGTLIVNCVGSLLMGVLIGSLALRGGNTALRLLMATGFLGGFTTFSTFSLDVATLWQRGEALPAVLYISASVVLSIAGVFLGLWLARTALS